MRQHTPGPWILNGSTVSGKDLVDGRGDYNESPICTISHSYRNPGVDNANARLIAAAPEILTALYNTVDALLQRSREDGDLDFWNRGGPGFEAIDATRALLAKIEGE